MDRMTPKQPLIIINWTYPEMLVWTSRKLIDVLVSLTEEIFKVGQFGMIFIHTPATNPTQHDLYGQNDDPTTIDYHQMDLLFRDVGVDKQEVD